MLINFFKEIKFVRDSVWLIISQVVLAVVGLTINWIVSDLYGVASFGAFSIGLKIYLILSLIGVVGCGSSIIHYLPWHKEDAVSSGKIIGSAITIGMIVTAVVCLIAFLSRSWIQSLFDINDSEMLIWFILALPFFILNKINLSTLNALREIKKYSILQTLRWLMTLLFIIFIASKKVSTVADLSRSFLYAEMVLFPLSSFFSWSKIRPNFSFKNEWIKKHLMFGTQSMTSTAIIDLYTYTDVFMIGILMNKKAVGIYSFAADIAKNMFTISNIVAINLNPIIAENWKNNKVDLLLKNLKRVRNATYTLYIPIVMLAMTVYYFGVNAFLYDTYVESILPFNILSIGVLLASGYKPMNGLPEMAGFPQTNLKINSIVLIVNVFLNLVLIRQLGIIGVSIATAVSYILSIILLFIFVKNKLGINIFDLTWKK